MLTNDHTSCPGIYNLLLHHLTIIVTQPLAEWSGLLPSKLEGNSSNPHKCIVGVFSSSIKFEWRQYFSLPKCEE